MTKYQPWEISQEETVEHKCINRQRVLLVRSKDLLDRANNIPLLQCSQLVNDIIKELDRKEQTNE